MAHVDIAADLNSEDETGLVWTFVDEAPDPSIIRPGEVVVVGDVHAPVDVLRSQRQRLQRRPPDPEQRAHLRLREQHRGKRLLEIKIEVGTALL